MTKTKLATRFKGTPESTTVEFTKHVNKVSDYVVLTAIYRAAPCLTTASVSTECTSAARIALQGHIECITLLLGDELHPVQRELCVNGALLLLPFLPFNIVFCNVVETANLDDLNTLKDLVQTMEFLAEKPDYASCAKQLRVFRALYNVAARYVEVEGCVHSSAQWGGAGLDAAKGHNNIAAAELIAASSPIESSSRCVESGSGIRSFGRGGGLGDDLEHLPITQILESQTWPGLGGLELDPLGTQFSSWFQETNDPIDFSR